MARHVRAFDWSRTPVGALERWPASLRAAAATCLNSRFPMAIYWGPELICLYNDAERDVIGGLHPRALATPARTLLDESWAIVGPKLEAVMAGGEATWAEDEELIFDRYGSPEIGYFTYSYGPIPDEEGGVGGILLVTQDTTARVNSHRRADLLSRLTASSVGAISDGEVCLRASEVLEGSLDLPLTLVYLVERDGAEAACTGVSGAAGRDREARPRIAMSDTADDAAAILREVTGAPSPGRLADVAPFLARGALGSAPGQAWVAPIRRDADAPTTGYVVAVINGRLTYDAPYRTFLELVAGQLGRAVGAAQAQEAERRATAVPELHAVLDELRAAQRRIAAAGDVERQRIERDLHDGAQQRLVALQFELGLLSEQLETDPRGALEQLGRLRHELDEALTELRELAHGVYPPLLGSDGLAAAVAAAGRRAPMPVSVSSGELEPLPRDVAAAAYFCCLEALQNAAKHAGAATRATVELARDGRALRFRVRDDGVGFDPGEVAESHGLVNLRDRLAALGGTAEIASAPGRGTSVEGRLPLG